MLFTLVFSPKYANNGVMKKLVLIILFMFLAMPVLATTLNGSAEYTTEVVRQIAFNGIQYKINKGKIITPNLFDPNAKENKNALKYGYVLGDRDLEQIKAKGLTAYVVTYKSDPFYSFYYLGRLLIGVDVNDKERKTDYPSRSFSYNTSGDLVSVTVNVAYGNNYIYDKKGSLKEHCKNNYCYDNSGKIVATRKVLEAYE